MAHFAKIDENNVVTDIAVVNNDDIQNLEFPESEAVGIAFLRTAMPWYDGDWKQTSFSSSFRRRLAYIGGTYSQQYDAFLEPQPFPSWTLDETELTWVPPTPEPTDGGPYMWDEATLTWVGRQTT